MERNVPPTTRNPSGLTSSTRDTSKSNQKSGKTKRGRGGDDDGWGGFRNYMDAKKTKLNEQFNRSGTGHISNIFAGIAIYVNGYTIPSSDELRRLIRQHGGSYEMYLSKTRVTHIVASNLPNSKFKLMKTMLVVKPSWITDSVAAGKRLSHVPYLLLGNQSTLQPGLKSFPSTTSLSRSSSTASNNQPDTVVPQVINADRVCEKLTENSDGLANLSFRAISENITAGRDSKFLKDVPTVSADGRKSSQNSDDLDGDDIVYNSEEENDKNIASDHTKSTTAPSNPPHREGNIKRRRSRVYSLKRFRTSNSGSFDLPQNESSNSCDSFITHGKSEVEHSEGGGALYFTNKISPCTKESDSWQCGSTSFLGSSNNCTIDASLSTTSGSLTSRPIHSSSSLWSSSASSVLPCGQPQAKSVSSSELQSVTTLPQTSHSTSVTEDRESLTLSTKLTAATSASPQVVSGAENDRTQGLKMSEFHGITTSLSTPLLTIPPTTTLPQNHSSDKSPAPIPPASSTTSATKIPTKPSPSKPSGISPHKTSSTMAKAGDKNFLSEFYSNSRLHHLSTWGAEFKAYVGEIQRSGNNTFPGRDKLRKVHVENTESLGLAETLDSGKYGVTSKTVMHIDMDCFFVSVGLLSQPDLRGKPVAVTHSRGQGAKPNPGSNLAWERAEWQKKRDGKLKGEKGKDKEYSSNRAESGYDFLIDKGLTGAEAFHSMAEIASCSYEARQAGVKNGMFMGKALLLCPELQTIPYNFAEYNRISKTLYDVVASYTHDIEAVSCDEMLIDCTDVLTDTGATAMEFAKVLRTEMMEKTGCPASTGIGPNILLAKLATRRAKPNGQFEVTTFEAKEFIKDQAVSDLPGVGYSMSRKLKKLGVETCGDLQNIPVSTLKREFGPKTGESLHQFSLGQDNREVKGDKQRKSVSAEINYGIRFTKEPDAIKFLNELSGEVKRRMDAISVKGRSITLKLMVRRPDAPVETAKFMGHGICNASNKSCNLPVATNDTNLIAREVVSLYRSQKVVASEIRGIGIQIHKLESTSGIAGISSGNQSGGHQSILNFAVGKNKAGSTAKVASTEVPNNTAWGATSANNTAVKDSSPKSVFKDISHSASKTNVQTTNYTTIRSNGRDVTLTGREAIHIGREVTHAFSHSTGSSDIPGPSGSKGSGCLNFGNIHPEQPGVNYTINPCVPSTSWAEPRPGPSTSRDKDPSHEFSFLTESQIDTGVLEELPSEIAEEILNDIKQRKQQRQAIAGITESNSRGANQQVDDNGTNQPEATTERAMENRTVTSALPSLSQKELKAEYARQEVTSQRSADKRAALGEGNELFGATSPLRNQGKQPGPPKPKGRGRPPGKKKLTFANKKTKGVGSKTMGKKTAVTRSNVLGTDVIICDETEDSNSNGFNIHGHFNGPEMIKDNEEETANTYEKKPSVENENTESRVEPEKEISLCGAVLLADVRVMLKEWLASCSEPQPDDIAMVTEYFTKLIQYKNLEQVFCLMRFLERKCRKLESVQWQECVENLTNYVQSIVCADYGVGIKL